MKLKNVLLSTSVAVLATSLALPGAFAQSNGNSSQSSSKGTSPQSASNNDSGQSWESSANSDQSSGNKSSAQNSGNKNSSQTASNGNSGQSWESSNSGQNSGNNNSEQNDQSSSDSGLSNSNSNSSAQTSSNSNSGKTGQSTSNSGQQNQQQAEASRVRALQTETRGLLSQVGVHGADYDRALMLQDDGDNALRNHEFIKAAEEYGRVKQMVSILRSERAHAQAERAQTLDEVRQAEQSGLNVAQASDYGRRGDEALDNGNFEVAEMYYAQARAEVNALASR